MQHETAGKYLHGSRAFPVGCSLVEGFVEGFALLDSRHRLRCVVALAWLATLVACDSEEQSEPAANIFAELGAPLPTATDDERAAFERGRAVLMRRFTPEDGLGPESNVTFCGGCHEKPVFGGSASHYRDFLLVGDELDTDVVVSRGKNGVQLNFSLDEVRAPSDPLTNLSATRNPIPFFGVGLLAEIPESEILSREDPTDADGDGISGRANLDTGIVGRFGRKAQTARLELFVRGPVFNHMGITSEPLSAERRARLPIADGERGEAPKQAVIPDEPTVDLDDVPDPELSDEDLFDLLSFVMLLAAPEPDAPREQTRRGQSLFADIGCDACHVPALEGPRGAIPAYSDLLLHDMGDELADGFPMGAATGREFRTQPLWGVVAVGPYLHDGRASTLDEAIRWHGGEGAASRDAYVELADADRQDLIAFLESLGGGPQSTAGLLPPGAPIPEEGQPGAPLPGLDEQALASFANGRALFDRDFGFSEGVGPEFNGDACRSCHFDPVIGGAGPGGVDAMRQGIVTEGTFALPEGGTALLRHSASSVRPEPSDGVNAFERRQTPTVLGLGLLERIPRETIEAMADPDDVDEDGIRGRAHVLPNGELGRFGWKANVPSVREFVRDALSEELGLTVPEDGASSFGVSVDDDEVADPELGDATIDAIASFLSLLSPPPRAQTSSDLESEGATLFNTFGCASCHVPELRTTDGVSVPAYTDLLLHDVAATTGRIEQGEATMGEFRTPPLWGLRDTAPYWHDGHAHSIEAAIAAHEGEAQSARDRVENAPASERAALLAFLESL
jgi:CxxC motif-containing protein (DUF1111 family)